MSYKTLVQLWNDFFFKPRPTEGMAVFRIVWCGLLSLYFLLDIENAADFYGPHGLISLETVKSQFQFFHANLFVIFGNTYDTTHLIMTVMGLSLLASLVGFYTRTSLVIMLFCLVSFHQRNIWFLSSSEVLIRVITVLMIFSPCGHSYSVDAWLSRKGLRHALPSEWAPWAWRLIQIQISVVYLWTVWHKLKGDNWFDGSAVYYATRLENMTNFPIPYLLDSVVFIKLMTWGTLGVEFALGSLIWIKEWRKPLILIGVIFHLGIEYMMSIPFFELVMIVLLINFYTPEELKQFTEQALGTFKNPFLRRRPAKAAWSGLEE